MTKSANDNMMSSLHLIRLMPVGLPACMEKNKNAQFDILSFCNLWLSQITKGYVLSSQILLLINLITADA